VKLHLNNTKENESDIEEEWKNLQTILKSAANESLGTIKRRNRRKYLKIGARGLNVIVVFTLGFYKNMQSFKT
jgi:hypothetical protein